jgi:hypothetical protein
MTALFRLDASDTSIMAADSIDQTRLEALVLEAIKASGSKGITQDELLGKFPHFSYYGKTGSTKAQRASKRFWRSPTWKVRP